MASPVARPCFRNGADQKTVRRTVIPTTAIQFCPTIKLPLRQTTGMAASLPTLAHPDRSVPDDTTLCRCPKTLPFAGHRGLVNAIAFRPDGARGLTGPRDATVGMGATAIASLSKLPIDETRYPASPRKWRRI
ncbi:transposase [Rhodobacter capsulatus]|nr:transposase [Rhodobacter capsulatus]